jgi:alpha-methylacyl-CoA racemase
VRASKGPLDGIRVVELAGKGPVPFCGMLLADFGADVTLVDRAPIDREAAVPLILRSRRSIAMNLKAPEGRAALLRLVERADVLIEGFRPGVMERLGVGPDECLDRNSRLVYGRMTGWGQVGPLAHTAGHDLNYIAVGGVLAHIGRHGQPPTPPLNLVGDYGGGAMSLAFGVLAALMERVSSGRGQVVDAAMLDGAALFMTSLWGLRLTSPVGWNEDARGSNIYDSGAPFYDVYETADNRYIAVAAIEEPFFRELMRLVGLPFDHISNHHDPAVWPELRERLTVEFARRTRDEWSAVFAGTDACVSPVLTMSEARSHPHVRDRATIVDYDGVLQPAPAPRLSRTPAAIRRPPASPGENSTEILADWGFSPAEIVSLREAGAIT